MHPTIIPLTPDTEIPGRIYYALKDEDEFNFYIIETDLSIDPIIWDVEGISNLTWSPNGEYVAVLSGTDNHYEIAILNNAGSHLTTLQTFNEYCPPYFTWSGDSQSLIWSSGNDIYLGDIQGEQVIVISDLPEDCDMWEMSWASERGILLVFKYLPKVESEIFAIDVNTLEQTRLTNNDTDDIFPTWAPDGSVFYYLSNSPGVSDYALYISDIEHVGEKERGIAEVRWSNNDWSPDSSKLMYKEHFLLSSSYTHNGSCYYDRETNKSHCLEDWTYYFVDWSPYEEILVLHKKEGQYALYCFDVEENTMYQVTEYIDQEIMRPHWIP